MEVALLERIHSAVACVTLVHDEWLATKRRNVDGSAGTLRSQTVHGKADAADLMTVELVLLSAEYTWL